MHAETAALNAPETYINPKTEPGTIAEIPWTISCQELLVPTALLVPTKMHLQGKHGRNENLLCFLTAVSLNVFTGNFRHKPDSNLQYSEGRNKIWKYTGHQEIRISGKTMESPQHPEFVRSLSIPLLEVHGHSRVRSPWTWMHCNSLTLDWLSQTPGCPCSPTRAKNPLLFWLIFPMFTLLLLAQKTPGRRFWYQLCTCCGLTPSPL